MWLAMTSVVGPERRFAATQRYVRNGWLSRHCADIVDLALLTLNVDFRRGFGATQCVKSAAIPTAEMLGQLLEHLVARAAGLLRNSEAERLGGLQVNSKLE